MGYVEHFLENFFQRKIKKANKLFSFDLKFFQHYFLFSGFVEIELDPGLEIFFTSLLFIDMAFQTVMAYDIKDGIFLVLSRQKFMQKIALSAMRSRR